MRVNRRTALQTFAGAGAGLTLVHYSEPTQGGHFPALEQSEIWSGAVSAFFGAL